MKKKGKKWNRTQVKETKLGHEVLAIEKVFGGGQVNWVQVWKVLGKVRRVVRETGSCAAQVTMKW